MNEKLHTSESSQESEFESNSIRQLKELLSKPAGAKSELVIRISLSVQDGGD